MNDRYWDLEDLNVCVVQEMTGVIVLSRHPTIEKARETAHQLSLESPGTIFAGLELIGNPRNDYQPGQPLDFEDVIWYKSAESCSMCNHPYAGPIKSLKHRCHIFRGSPLCLTVEENRVVNYG